MSVATDTLLAAWTEAWPDALAAWSPYTRLHAPHWCCTAADAKREGLTGSFAMIRLQDHAVVIDLDQIARLGLDHHAREILAHEVGHHVLAPGDLRDHARLLARMRAALPGQERRAAEVANLYTDLLINDRLQRQRGLDMAGVYRAIRRPGPTSRLWSLYLRIYERLWRLEAGSLGADPADREVDADAVLGAELIRVYGQRWMAGAGRFACLLLPYLVQESDQNSSVIAIWHDTRMAGTGDELPDGLADVEDDEQGGALHPSEDPALGGDLPTEDSQPSGSADRRRDPRSWMELMESLGVRLTPQELLIRYYRELAAPHLMPYPLREIRPVSDPQPEGLDTWDAGSPLHEIAWGESLTRSPMPIPGITTLRRVFSEVDGGSPRREPIDCYLGIDCSGSMANPAQRISYPVIAGTVVTLSAMRAGARVMACLSGEPGRYSETAGFTAVQRDVLGILTGYLGTGMSFGTERLRATFIAAPPPRRPVHLLIVSDADWFWALGHVTDGWELAAEVARIAGGGATAVLNIVESDHRRDIARLAACGWQVHAVTDLAELVTFAQRFSRQTWGGIRA